MSAARTRGRRARYAAIAGLTLLFLSPLVFMVIGSLRPPGLPPPEGFELVPTGVTPRSYEAAFQLVPLARYMANSLVVVAIAVPATIVVASWAGFAIATADPRWARRLVVVSVVALMVPVSALWVPRFIVFRHLGLIDTLWPLVAPALLGTTPFYVLIFALAYSRIPSALYEAARLEGLSPLSIWRRVAWPLARPAAFAVAVLAFVFHWSNFVDALLYLGSEDNYTLPLALRALQTLEPSEHGILLAASVIVTLPPVVAFFLAQRSFFAKTLGVA